MLQREIRLDLSDVTPAQALEEIARLGGIQLAYRPGLLPTRPTLSIHADRITVGAALHRVLSGTRLIGRFGPTGHLSLVREPPSESYGIGSPRETGSITGVVTSAAGLPLKGAAVNVMGTARSTRTDEDGRFAFDEVSAGDHALRASFPGYAEGSSAVTVSAGRRSTAHILLKAEAVELESVVVVAYGTRRRSELIGSVAEVDAEQFGTQAVDAVDQALAGKASGMQVTQGSGVPGGAPLVVVRGVSSVSAGTGPLFVIDGVPIGSAGVGTTNPLASLPPSDIETVTVLKDAASTSLYGSRASGGVVLITTRRGANGSPRISLGVRSGIQSIPGYERPDLMSAREYVQFRKESVIDNVFQPAFYGENDRWATEQETEAWFASRPEASVLDPARYGEGTDWWDEVTRLAPTSEYTTSVSGGTAELRYFLSGDYLNQRGVILHTGFQRYALRSNIDVRIREKLRVRLDVAPSRTVQQLANVDAGTGGVQFTTLIGRVRQAVAVAPVRGPDGSLLPTTRVEPAITPFYATNPVIAATRLEDRQVSDRVILRADVAYEPLPGLLLSSTLGADGRNGRHEAFNPSTVSPSYQNASPVIPSAARSEDGFLSVLSENTATYSHRFAGRHTTEILGGVSFQRDRSSGAEFTATNFPDDDVHTFNAALTVRGTTSRSEATLLSYFGRLNYGLDDRFLLTASLRTDGSSRFGSQSRWGYFPSIAVAWRVSNEAFMHSFPVISDLKLKAGVGLTGNNSIGDYSAQGAVGGDNYVFGPEVAQGRTVTAVPNRALTWEKSSQLDAGVELGLFSNRMALTVDGYSRVTRALLFNVPMATVSGFAMFLDNVGRIRNRGVEVGLNTVNSTGAVRWETSLNLSVNRNKVLELGPDGQPLYLPAPGTRYTITEVGKPVGLFYGRKMIGLFTEAELADPKVPKYPGATIGSPRYVDGNGNGILELTSDFVVVGSPHPAFTFGISNTFAHGRFDLQASAVGAVGGQVYDLYRQINWNTDGVFNLSRDVIDRWRPGKDPAAYRMPGTASTLGRESLRGQSSLMVQDAGYLSVRNATLGYEVGDQLVARGIPLPGARVYLSIENPFLFSQYRGNPEVRRVSDPPLMQGINQGSYATARTFTLGLNAAL